jgi:hypothetical protein
MPTVDIILLSRGIEPTEENINKYIEQQKQHRKPEPDFVYDLTIPYEDLVNNPNQVKVELKEKFGIDVVGDWLNSYAIA